MTQARLNHRIAARTGESLAVIRRLGFSLVTERRDEPGAEGICLVVLDPEVNTAITKRQSVHEDELLGENERGHQVLRLRAEKDNLLDIVRLATSPSQVRQLWAKISELLGDEPTELERQAILIPQTGEEGG
jgi:hypothetical protein